MNRRILWDCHMHSSFSADSPAPMEDMIRQAVFLGLQGITFTEHLDPDYPATPDGLDFSLDIPSYQEKLFQLQDTYKDKIQIRFGIELGLQMHLADYFHSLMQEFPFDFAIGSSHLVHGFDPYYPEFFQGRKESRCYMEYFESILENLSCCEPKWIHCCGTGRSPGTMWPRCCPACCWPPLYFFFCGPGGKNA